MLGICMGRVRWYRQLMRWWGHQCLADGAPMRWRSFSSVRNMALQWGAGLERGVLKLPLSAVAIQACLFFAETSKHNGSMLLVPHTRQAKRGTSHVPAAEAQEVGAEA